MDTLSLAEAIYYDPEYSGSEDDMANIRAIQAAIDERIADARAAGYAEAKEQAAKLLGEKGCGSSFCLHPGAIRALKPATTKEQPKEGK